MIVTRTPLRVSFVGGGTDFPDYYNQFTGACLTSAIDKFIYVVVKPRFDDKIVLHYTKTEVVDRLEDIKHDLIRESLRLAGIEKGIEVTTLADIPSEGTGLGSSSTITVGLLHAFYTLKEVEVTPEKLAEDACKVEIEILGKGIGKQDQYIAAFGGFSLIVFQKDRITIKHLKRKIRRQLDERHLLFYTGIHRQADGLLKEQVNCSNRNEILHKQMKLCVAGYKDIQEEGYSSLGGLINQGWQLKKQLTEAVTNPTIEEMYNKAMEAGAKGCKVCGAGGGGFLLVSCEGKDKGYIRAELSDYKELRFKLESEGSKLILNDR